MVLWLQSIGYFSVPHQGAELQTLEMSLDKSSDLMMVDLFGMPALTDGSLNSYFDAVVVLDFKKLNHPNIQLLTSRGPPLEMVLNFHSSKCSNFCF
jgi:hypothetical protein